MPHQLKYTAKSVFFSYKLAIIGRGSIAAVSIAIFVGVVS
jgi:hypothetical protein